MKVQTSKNEKNSRFFSFFFHFFFVFFFIFVRFFSFASVFAGFVQMRFASEGFKPPKMTEASEK